MHIILLFFFLISISWAQDNPQIGDIEIVAELPINPGNIAVSSDNRIFATIHQFRSTEVSLVEITAKDSYQAWPDMAWNNDKSEQHFNNLLGIQIDSKNRLWVLDNGLGKNPQTPKILAFNIDSKELVYSYYFSEAIAAKGSFLNDLAVDENHGFIYIADIGGAFEPALVILDIHKNQARRFTDHFSLQAEAVDLVPEGKLIQLPDQEGILQPARIAINPITLSADKNILYFGAMTGETWYGIETKLLRDGASDNRIKENIYKVGDKPVSDGASTDKEGNHFFTAVNINGIVKLDSLGKLTTLVTDERMIWPDALSFAGNHWLYIATNQLNRSAMLNQGVEAGRPPYLIMRVWTGTKGMAGR